MTTMILTTCDHQFNLQAYSEYFGKRRHIFAVLGSKLAVTISNAVDKASTNEVSSYTQRG